MTRFAPGTPILHRFLQHGVAVDVRPVTVLADDERGLVLWLADGTPTIMAVLPGGIDLRAVSKPEMFGERWQTAPRTWRNNVLMVLPPDAEYAVWSFFDPADGALAFWYANLQSPFERWDGGIDMVDHQLDLVVSPRHEVEWKDEDELAAAVAAGWLSARESDRIYAEAKRLAIAAEAGSPPFSHALHSLRPAGLPIPALPPDWSRPQPTVR
ncbi:MAG: hypothetical protein QOI35_3715 [Cryptosporangiaceae bacterium]|nr:hypothetical protein [Cryptosporangiaceae bacterium]